MYLISLVQSCKHFSHRNCIIHGCQQINNKIQLKAFKRNWQLYQQQDLSSAGKHGCHGYNKLLYMLRKFIYRMDSGFTRVDLTQCGNSWCHPHGHPRLPDPTESLVP